MPIYLKCAWWVDIFWSVGCWELVVICLLARFLRLEGARANLGIKKGRYLFEVKIVEAHNPSEGWHVSLPTMRRNVTSRTLTNSWHPGPQRSYRSTVSRNLVRVGFSTQACGPWHWQLWSSHTACCSSRVLPLSSQGSSLLLGEGESVYFDNDGFYVAEQKRDLTRSHKKPERGSWVVLALSSVCVSPRSFFALIWNWVGTQVRASHNDSPETIS